MPAKVGQYPADLLGVRLGLRGDGDAPEVEEAVLPDDPREDSDPAFLAVDGLREGEPVLGKDRTDVVEDVVEGGRIIMTA